MECGEGGDKTLPNELTKGKGGRMRARFERAARERNRERERGGEMCIVQAPLGLRKYLKSVARRR